MALDEDGKPTDARVRARLRRAISQELRQDTSGVLLSRTGWAKLPNGKYIYNTGTRVLGDTVGIKVMLSEALPSLALEVVSCAVATRFLKHFAEHYDLISAEIRSALSDFHADASVPQRRFCDTATVAETHRRLLAESHNISENALRGLILPAVKLGRKTFAEYAEYVIDLKKHTGTKHVLDKACGIYKEKSHPLDTQRKLQYNRTTRR